MQVGKRFERALYVSPTPHNVLEHTVGTNKYIMSSFAAYEKLYQESMWRRRNLLATPAGA